MGETSLSLKYERKGEKMLNDKNELSEILLGDTRKKSSRSKKSVVFVFIVVVFILLVAFFMWKFLGANEEKISKSGDGTLDKSIATPFENDFGNLGGIDFDPNTIDDSILKGIEDIQKPQEAPKPEEAESSSLDVIINRLADSSQQSPQNLNSRQTTPQTTKPIPQQQPQNAQSKHTTLSANGSTPTTGFYWQLGSFSKEPKAEFVALVKKYSYRIQKTTNKNGLTTTRYLLGPYPSEAQAPTREDVQKIFSESPVRVFIP